MKDLLAVVTAVSGDTVGCAANYALALAGLTGAHLTALIAEIESGSGTPSVEPDNMQGGIEGARSLSTMGRLTRTTELIQAAAKLANVPCTLLSDGRSLSLRELLIGNAQVRDCVILDVQGPLRHPRQGLIEAVLFGSGRPIILVPRTARPFAHDRILVAWDATRSAVRALHDALPLLIRARDVAIVSVTDDKEFPAAHSGEDVCRYLSRWDVDSHFERVKRGSQNVGLVLLDHAVRIEADLLVMGGFGHPREREFIFGSATRDIFQSNIENAVLLSH